MQRIRIPNIPNDKRSSLLYKNIVASFFIKGWSAVVVLLMVPLTLTCLGSYQNGVWLTVSSLLMWIDQMDIGLGNGLRNRLAEHMALNEWKEARQIISSTLAMLICIVIPIILVLLILVWKTDIYGFLNVIPQEIPELRIALTCAVILVCMTFVMKLIGNVYMGMQMPAVSNFLMASGQTIALIATWFLYNNGNATFLNIVVVNTISPLIIYMLAFPYTFFYRYPKLRPSFKHANLHSAIELGNLSIKFFWLQIAALIQFMTANILISNFFTPAMVTPYQIAYRYMSIVMVVFTIICMPFWNATTDAFLHKDMDWIRRANHKMNLMSMGIAILLILMVIISPLVYSIWIGKTCDVPLGMTSLMALYIFLMVLSMRYSYFLNGIGALRLQLYMTTMTVIFIPLAWFVCKFTQDILWFMAIMCFCIAPSIAVNLIQFNKVLNGTAKGVWRI